MKIGGIQFPVFNPYIKSTVEIYISGCNKKCPGCHNPELQNFDFGKDLDIDKLVSHLKEREDLFDIISITGGELLDQVNPSAEQFICKLLNNFEGKQFWLFTGKNKEEIPSWVYEYFDFIKVGSYDETKKTNSFPISSNQQLLVKGKDY